MTPLKHAIVILIKIGALLVSKAVLPKKLRMKIINFLKDGLSTLEVYDSVYEESAMYVSSDKQLSRSIRRLSREVRKEYGKADTSMIHSEPPPGPKKFNTTNYSSMIDSLSQSTPNKEFERACLPIAADILINYEGFSSLINANKIGGFHNPPFDFFGYKRSRPYISTPRARHRKEGCGNYSKTSKV
jgi:hypothetical protein